MPVEKLNKEDFCQFLSDNLRDGDLVLTKKVGPISKFAGQVLQVMAKPLDGAVPLLHPEGAIFVEGHVEDFKIDVKYVGAKFCRVFLRDIVATTRPMV